MCQRFTETTMPRRLLEVFLAELLMAVSLLVIFIGLIALWVISRAERPPVITGPISKYDFDINEHQNYWEADSR